MKSTSKNFKRKRNDSLYLHTLKKTDPRVQDNLLLSSISLGQLINPDRLLLNNSINSDMMKTMQSSPLVVKESSHFQDTIEAKKLNIDPINRSEGGMGYYVNDKRSSVNSKQLPDMSQLPDLELSSDRRREIKEIILEGEELDESIRKLEESIQVLND